MHGNRQLELDLRSPLSLQRVGESETAIAGIHQVLLPKTYKFFFLKKAESSISTLQGHSFEQKQQISIFLRAFFGSTTHEFPPDCQFSMVIQILQNFC